MGRVSRLGMLGGTFDPPHYGHLVVAQESYHALQLERVLFTPAGCPPHKLGEPVSALEHRVSMTELAIASDERFELCRADLEAGRPSFTLDLLQRLGTEYPSAELFFLVGMDSLADLPTWHEPARILELCTLVAVHRPGQREVDLQRLPPDLRRLADRIRLLWAPGVDVSSTDLRRRVAERQPIRYLTPDPVVRYIEAHGLYRR
ncbi:MAG: nicotinate-nucleotide adenylyltransferase [Chloroflexi bacterium]|nr:nicotinate-nucleotide adenylyltransferase [Chloroflexota bacterium]